jgi:NAD(P)-dependent dehydrogenase (short-subunit alcohol dehydrogenase family)
MPGVTARAALVTGAGRGIGAATAMALAARGDQVLAVARTEHELSSLAEAAPVDYLVGDVSSAGGCARIAQEALTRLGQVDVLINNAGMDPGEPPIWAHQTASWRQMMAVNLDAPFELTRLLAEGMKLRGWGRIVMVSSTAGIVGGASMAAYCASKHGLLGLMRSAARDLAPFGVTCNAVAPGWVRTRMSDATADREARQRGIPVEQVWDERVRSYAAGRVVDAAEVASVIAFLSSEQAAAVNGEADSVSLGEMW